jgi:very-short-patch-repair endonuclease
LDREYKRTCLEERMFTYLSQLGIPFFEQYPTRSGFIVDFLILVKSKGGKTIGIETDGSNWHSSWRQRRKDRFRDRLLGDDGWIIIRFGETFTLEDVKAELKPLGVSGEKPGLQLRGV